MKSAEKQLAEALDCQEQEIYKSFLHFHPEWIMKKVIGCIKLAQNDAYNQALHDVKMDIKICDNTIDVSVEKLKK